MAIIINDPYARGGGGVAGQQFGEVLSTGLQKLAETKMANMERRKTAAALLPKVGGDTQLAYLLAGDKDMRRDYFKEQFKRPGRDMVNSAYSQAAGLPTSLTQSIGSAGVPGYQTSGMEQTKSSQEEQPLDLKGLTPQEAATAIQLRNAKLERAHKEKVEAEKSVHRAYEYNKKYSDTTQKDAAIARKSTNTYKNLINLAKSGDLRSGGWYKTLDSLGLNEFYRNPATQLAQKEIASMAQGAAAAFNTPRLNAMEVGLYEKSLVTMGNTPPAMITIAKNEVLKNDAMELKDRTRREIIRENGNKPPYDLADQVNDRIEPKLAQLAQVAQDNVKLTTYDKSLADASDYSPDTIIRVDGVEYQPQGQYWVRVENGS